MCNFVVLVDCVASPYSSCGGSLACELQAKDLQYMYIYIASHASGACLLPTCPVQLDLNPKMTKALLAIRQYDPSVHLGAAGLQASAGKKLTVATQTKVKLLPPKHFLSLSNLHGTDDLSHPVHIDASP